jgi:hypothetical protein
MTLAKTLRQKLSETPAAEERHELNLADEASGWSLYLTADRRDAWTTVVWEMSVRRAPVQGDIAAWAQRIAEETSGLLEALRVVEVDAPHHRALLRSEPPSELDDKISYYEVVLQGTSSAVVRRFEGTRAFGKREQIPFVLTNEVLAKWAGTLVNVE